jgi:hypothetical protein
MIFPDHIKICGHSKTDSVICMIQSLYDQEISCGDSKIDSVINMIQSLLIFPDHIKIESYK